MNQRAFLQQFDADACGAFFAAGMADAATYVAPGGESVPCLVLVDRDAAFFDDAGQVAGRRVVVAIQRADVAGPERGGIVTLIAGGERFELDALASADESLTRWVVTDV